MEKQLKIRGIVFLSGNLLFLMECLLVSQRMITSEQKFAMFLFSYLIIGFGVFRELSEDIINRNAFDDIYQKIIDCCNLIKNE